MEDQLLCLGTTSQQLRRYASDDAVFCNGKKECVGGADENGCPSGDDTLIYS